MIELQGILKKYGKDFLENHKLSYDQTKAFRAILNCRTAALGGHADTCDECGFQRISYNSCRNRNCPKCQTFAKEQWIEKQNESLLNVGYFHIVFTLPDKLNTLVYQNQALVYNLFFKAMSETLLELGLDEKYLGAKLGITAVLHTWGQNLLYHPHIHCIIPGGGITADGKWVYSRKKFFMPVKVLSKKFRGKFLFYLKRAKLCFYSNIKYLENPREFDAFISNLYQKDWIVYCKPPFKNATKVVEYLGRYTHRVAISNNRILKAENGYITFKWRDYRDSSKSKTMTVTADEFIRRFMLHILPSGFCKIRHYGILASRNKIERIRLCKKLTNTQVFPTKNKTVLEKLKDILGKDFNQCPCCGIGNLSRAPPEIQTA